MMRVFARPDGEALERNEKSEVYGDRHKKINYCF